MKLKKYPLRIDHSYKIFEFTSEGPKGKIIKLIIFERLTEPFVFNLAFGDKCPKAGKLDDPVVSDNSDTEKVLATIAEAVFLFLNKHSGTNVYAAGSTPSGNRMYRMGISKYLHETRTNYDILGRNRDCTFEPYQEDKNYMGFAIRLKHRKFII